MALRLHVLELDALARYTATPQLSRSIPTTLSTTMFEFAKGDERWAWCDYGAVELFRKLDDSATMCTITTKTKKPEFFISALVQCK